MSDEREHDHCEETRAFPAVLTRADLKHLEAKLDAVGDSVRTLAAEVKAANERHAQNDVWKAQIDMRLGQGVERMNRLEAEVEGRVKKETLIAYLAGAGFAGAGLAKILGLIT